MRLSFWLRSFCRNFAGLANQPINRRRRAEIALQPAAIEALEHRQLLTAGPVLTGAGATVNYVEGSPGLTIAPHLAINSQTNLTSATVTFTNWQPEDRANFLNSFALQHMLTQNTAAHTATLTITGVDTAAHYQTTLASVFYSDVSGNPNTLATRIATFTVTDANSKTGSTTQNITVTSVNNPPVIAINDSTSRIYHLGGPAVAIANLASVTDPDSSNLTKLTVQITSGYQNNANGHDVLSLTDNFGIIGTFNATTGTLTLTSDTGNSASGSFFREALRLATFSTSGTSVSTATRTLSFIGTDDFSTPASNVPVTRDIAIAPTNLNQRPVVQVNDSGSLSYLAPGPGVAILSQALVTDPDNSNLSKLTVQISSGYQNDANGHDLLSFSPNGIAGSFDATTGALTLSGVSPLATYQQVLRTVKFSSSGSAVSAATRTFVVIVTDDFSPTPESSIAVSRNLTVTVDAAPVLSGIEGTTLNVVGTGATPITASLTVSDSDSPNLTQATVKISGNYQQGEDVLAFTTNAKIRGVWNPTIATLTLDALGGSAPAADFTAALRAVTYRDTSSAPNTGSPRTILFQATDGLVPSNTVSRDVTVQTANGPVLTGAGSTTNFTEGQTSVTIAAALSVTSQNITSATVSFTNWQAEDRVNFLNTYALQHTFTQNLTAHTATLTITGLDTAAHYQTLLRSVFYWDVSDNPNMSVTRLARFTVTDMNSVGGSATQNITVTNVNDPPVIAINDSTSLTYHANAAPVAVASQGTVTDPDSLYLTKLTVQITSGYQNNANGHDVLSLTDHFGIVGSFDAATGTLTLTSDSNGKASGSDFRRALQQVTFSSTGSAVTLGNRTLTLIDTDDFTPPASSVSVTRTITVTT